MRSFNLARFLPALAAMAIAAQLVPPLQAQTQDAPPAAAKMAEVSVSSAEPLSLDSKAGWSNIPDYVAGAKIYAQEAKGGDLDFTAKTDGLVIIAASWTYDGNNSGGWYETRTTREQLVEQGWIALDDLIWNEKDTHTLFFRYLKAGDTFKFHTRKYNQPFLIAADATKITSARERFAKAAAAAKAKMPASATAAKPAARPPDGTTAGQPAKPSAPMLGSAKPQAPARA